MEADWSVEIGADLPLIAVPWESFVDLRRDLAAARRLRETAVAPVLAESLIELNQESSPVFTSKCDFWLLTTDEIDPLEFDAAREDACQGVACYIDIIPRSMALFASFAAQEVWVRSAVDEMRTMHVQQARAELVIRSSAVDEREGYALTLYVASCGRSEDSACEIFHGALKAAAAITMKQAAIAGE